MIVDLNVIFVLFRINHLRIPGGCINQQQVKFVLVAVQPVQGQRIYILGPFDPGYIDIRLAANIYRDGLVRFQVI